VEALIAGESGVTAITKIDVSDIPAKIAGQVVRGKGEGEFDADKHIEPKEQKKMDEFIHFGMGAADEAIAQAGLANLTKNRRSARV
jgi:3-oxoacyl-[acyl-carrier-protein] synthase II